MDPDYLIDIANKLLEAAQGMARFNGMKYDPPIASAKMQIQGGVMQFKTANSDWQDCDAVADGWLGISTIQMDGDKNELPTSNRIVELRWKPANKGEVQNLTTYRVE